MSTKKRKGNNSSTGETSSQLVAPPSPPSDPPAQKRRRWTTFDSLFSPAGVGSFVESANTKDAGSQLDLRPHDVPAIKPTLKSATVVSSQTSALSFPGPSTYPRSSFSFSNHSPISTLSSPGPSRSLFSFSTHSPISKLSPLPLTSPSFCFSSGSCSNVTLPRPSHAYDSTRLSGTPHQQRVVALDCEMVEVNYFKSALARCSIVNYFGKVIFDEYVRPEQKITDYRTHVSGIRESDMDRAMPFQDAKKKIHKILENKIIIGQSLEYDFEVLQLKHPTRDVRDTADHIPLRTLAGLPLYRTPSLKKLSAKILHKTIQEGSHCSVVDALAVLDIYQLVEKEWEESVI